MRPMYGNCLDTSSGEIVYALADIEWHTPENDAIAISPAQFEADEPGYGPWLVMYLDRPVAAGERRTVPISIMLSNRPQDEVLREGASFTIGYTKDGVTKLDGRGSIVAVRRFEPSASDELFHELILACRQPTEAILRGALEQRAELTVPQADFITYLAGFTHHEFSQSATADFGIKRANGGLPSVLDGDALHVKVLLDDLTHDFLGLSTVPIAERYCVPIYRNNIAWREPSGAYTNGFDHRGKDFDAYNRYIMSLTEGLTEEVVSFHEDVGSRSVVLHAAQVPARNTAINLHRLFSNVSVVALAYEKNPMYNVSFERLLAEAAVLPMLKQALWLVIETKDSAIAEERLRGIGARYTVVPGSAFNETYMEQVIACL